MDSCLLGSFARMIAGLVPWTCEAFMLISVSGFAAPVIPRRRTELEDVEARLFESKDPPVDLVQGVSSKLFGLLGNSKI